MSKQIELFPRLSPERLAQLENLKEWLADGTELRRLGKLMKEMEDHPYKPKFKPKPSQRNSVD